METHPANQAAFHRFMEAQFASLPTWLDVFDFQAELGGNAGSADVMLVDVGGGNGSQCAGLRRAWPDMPGRMILQDKPQVLERALQVQGMEKMGHDFLTEQPIKSEFNTDPYQSETCEHRTTNLRKMHEPTISAKLCTISTTTSAPPFSRLI